VRRLLVYRVAIVRIYMIEQAEVTRLTIPTVEDRSTCLNVIIELKVRVMIERFSSPFGRLYLVALRIVYVTMRVLERCFANEKIALATPTTAQEVVISAKQYKVFLSASGNCPLITIIGLYEILLSSYAV
jgi:hypothetical protein